MLLALDTSTRRIGVALYDAAQVLFETMWTSNFHHTVELAPAVQRALRHAGRSMDDVQAVAVAVGPGSFTSLRSGLAFAKGLALARSLPLIGVPSLDFLAASQPVSSDYRLAAVLEAGRKRLAVGWYECVEAAWQPTGRLELLTAAGLSQKIRQPTWVCGELDESARALLRRKWKNVRLASPAQSQRRPAFLAELAWARRQAGKLDDPATLSPIYLSQSSP